MGTKRGQEPEPELQWLEDGMDKGVGMLLAIPVALIKLTLLLIGVASQVVWLLARTLARRDKVVADPAKEATPGRRRKRRDMSARRPCKGVLRERRDDRPV